MNWPPTADDVRRWVPARVKRIEEWIAANPGSTVQEYDAWVRAGDFRYDVCCVAGDMPLSLTCSPGMSPWVETMNLMRMTKIIRSTVRNHVIRLYPKKATK